MIEQIENVRDLERFLRYSGMSRKIAKTLASRIPVISQGDPGDLISEKDKIQSDSGFFRKIAKTLASRIPVISQGDPDDLIREEDKT
jgi:hypothetical protein